MDLPYRPILTVATSVVPLHRGYFGAALTGPPAAGFGAPRTRISATETDG